MRPGIVEDYAVIIKLEYAKKGVYIDDHYRGAENKDPGP